MVKLAEDANTMIDLYIGRKCGDVSPPFQPCYMLRLSTSQSSVSCLSAPRPGIIPFLAH